MIMSNLLKGNKSVKMTALGALFAVIFLIFGTACILTNTEKCIADTNEDKYFTNVTVEEGDTLWELASEYMDEEHYDSIYEYMDELKHMNNMTSDDIYAGQNMVVTYYKSK
jgi:hypothetical protein